MRSGSRRADCSQAYSLILLQLPNKAHHRTIVTDARPYREELSTATHTAIRLLILIQRVATGYFEAQCCANVPVTALLLTQ